MRLTEVKPGAARGTVTAESSSGQSCPFVSVIIPARNEEQYVERCLDSLLNQHYKRNAYEIIVVDGMSEDNTRQVVLNYTRQHPNIFLLDNPHRYTSYALNLGIKASRGAVIILLGAHSFADADFVAASVWCLQKTGADCVGGPIETIGETFMARVIALAMSSPFGVGNALFRYSQEEGYVDTVAFGAYPRAVFEKVGMFDEELIRNQDDEFNYRLRKAGGKIFLTPKIKSSYCSRASLKKLWQQYFRYGFWKVKTLVAHPDSLRWRQIVPPILVATFFISGGLLFLLWPLGAAVPTLYGLALGVASLVTASRRGWRYLPILPFVFATVHFSWGLGFWVGLFRWSVPRFGFRDLPTAFEPVEKSSEDAS